MCNNGHQYYKSSDCPKCLMCEVERKPKDDFLSILVAPARGALENNGITTLEKLSEFNESEIMSLHGIGKSSIPKLNKLLSDKNRTFNVK